METKNIPGVTITNNELQLLAISGKIDPAALKAVQIVETGGQSGFVSRQHPTILFEGHIFRKLLINHGISPEHLACIEKDEPEIVYPKWDKTKYYGGLKEYERLNRAIEISKLDALLSTSWGMFQILGLNHGQCGESSIIEFVKKMTYSEYHQMILAINYLRSNNLIPMLNTHNWTAFAKKYNGPGYAQNHYDIRLRDAYNQSRNIFK